MYSYNTNSMYNHALPSGVHALLLPCIVYVLTSFTEKIVPYRKTLELDQSVFVLFL